MGIPSKFLRRNYLCVVEGQQEQMYLKHLAYLLNCPPQKTVTFNTKIGDSHDLEKTYVDYDSVCLFDHDFNTIAFERNLSKCIELNKKNNQRSKSTKRNVYHAYSIACFDLWLILHKKYFDRPVSRAKDYVEEVRQTFNLPRNADIKNKTVMEQILQQISLSDVKDAISRAEKICEKKLQCDTIQLKEEIYYPNPYFSIHKFIDMVIRQMS